MSKKPLNRLYYCGNMENVSLSMTQQDQDSLKHLNPKKGLGGKHSLKDAFTNYGKISKTGTIPG